MAIHPEIVTEQLKRILGAFPALALIMDKDYNLLWENGSGNYDLPERLGAFFEKASGNHKDNANNNAIMRVANKKIAGILVPFEEFSVFMAAVSDSDSREGGGSGVGSYQTDSESHAIDLIYSSSAMKETVAFADRAAGIAATVLLSGETGAGKTILAKYIHSKSSRRNAPFVSINCGAIPVALVESELFGYEKGAFTGAYKTGKVGLFETAIGGTILLDEIGEISKDIQVKILHAIEDKKIVRVGGREPIPLDIRLIAATNKDLTKMVSDGDFREDLYYRLNVISFSVPPLRNRKDDIVELTKHFLGLNNKKYNLDKVLDPEVMKILMEYKWPGNVRELQNSLERMIVMSEGDVIGKKDLPANIISFINNDAFHSSHPEKGSLQNEKDMLERDLIQQALTECNSIRKAALKLGISHVTLLRKIERLNMRSTPKRALEVKGQDA
jgi:transcriptional regulator with PAS, ATPase and Fis domain